jgi:hypothetical protein
LFSQMLLGGTPDRTEQAERVDKGNGQGWWWGRHGGGTGDILEVAHLASQFSSGWLESVALPLGTTNKGQRPRKDWEIGTLISLSAPLSPENGTVLESGSCVAPGQCQEGPLSSAWLNTTCCDNCGSVSQRGLSARDLAVTHWV